MPVEDALRWIESDLVQRIGRQIGGEQSTIEQCEVKALEGDKDNWASIMFSLKFILKHSGKEEKYDLFVKLMDENENVRHTMQSDKQFSNEIHLYSHFVPKVLSLIKKPTLRVKLEALFPKCYYTSFSGCTGATRVDDGVVVMENLQLLGYKLGNRESLDLNHLIIAVQRLGAFHAMSYYMKEKHADEFHAKLVPPIFETLFLPKFKDDVNVTFGVGHERILEVLARELPENDPGLQRLRNGTKEPYETLLKLVEAKEPLALVNHGDFLRNNVLFQYDGDEVADMKMLDFQTIRYASPAIDLSLILLMNSTHEVRVPHFNTLLKKYHDSVVTTLADMLDESVEEVEKRYTFAAFLDDFRQHALYGYYITVNFLPWMLAEEDDLAEMVRLWRDAVGSQEYKDKILTVGGERSTKELVLLAKDLLDLGFL